MYTVRIILAGMVVAMLGGAIAIAQEEAEGRPDRSELRKKMVELFDEDGDGQLNEAERATAREVMRERRGRGAGAPRAEGRGPRADRGPAEGPRRGTGEGLGEGRGPRAERGPAADRPRREPGPALDGDRPRGRGQGQGPRDGRGPGPGGQQGPPWANPERVFKRLDADGDGSLSLKEFTKFTDFMQRMRDRLGPPDGDRPSRGPRADRGRDFDGERFRPNFNRDDDRGDRPRSRRGRPEGDRDFRRGRGGEFGPPEGAPGRGRGPGLDREGRRGPPEFRRGGPPPGDAEDDAPRPERRRRGRPDVNRADPAPADEQSEAKAEEAKETAEATAETEEDTV